MRHFTDQEIINRIDQAPPLIQDRVGDPRTILEVISIGKNKNLHIDQIGKVAEMTRNLLIGLVNPQDFLQELVAAGMTELVARQIMTEINQTIFMPLREKMKSAAPGAPAPTAIQQRVASPTPTVPSATEPTHYFHLENKLPPVLRIRPLPVTPRVETQVPPKIVPPTPQSMRPVMPEVRPSPIIPKVEPQIPQPQKSPLAQAVANAQQRQFAPAQQKPVNILSEKPAQSQQPFIVPPRPAAPAIAFLPPKSVLPQPILPRPTQPIAPRPMMNIVPHPIIASPANLSGALRLSEAFGGRGMPPRIVPEVQPSPAILPPLPKAAEGTAMSIPPVPPVPAEPYSADPYREPIE